MVLMDSYQGGMNLEECQHMSTTLRVGDGATVEDSETEDSRTPSPCGGSLAKKEDTDEVSLDSSVGEDAPLLQQGGSSGGALNSFSLFLRSSTPVSSPERPLRLIPPSAQRLSPEGCSFSSSSSSSSSSPTQTSSLPSPQTPD